MNAMNTEIHTEPVINLKFEGNDTSWRCTKDWLAGIDKPKVQEYVMAGLVLEADKIGFFEGGFAQIGALVDQESLEDLNQMVLKMREDFGTNKENYRVLFEKLKIGVEDLFSDIVVAGKPELFEELKTKVDNEKLAVGFGVGGDSRKGKDYLENHDRWVTIGGTWAVVFDGVGTDEGAVPAAEEAGKKTRQLLALGSTRAESVERMEMMAKGVLEKASEAIMELKVGGKARTTACLAGEWEDAQTGEKKAVFASVGNSRAYLYRDGESRIVTDDDDVISGENPEEEKMSREVREALDKGEVLYDNSLYNTLVNPEYKDMISQALGKAGIEVHTKVIDVRKGDRIILETDGAYVVKQAERDEILAKGLSPAETAKVLVEAAYAKEDWHDDVTVVVLDL